MSRGSSEAVTVMQWKRSGNTIGTSCPKCGTWMTVYAGRVNEDGITDSALACKSRQCDWKNVVKFDKYKPRVAADLQGG
jgi:hypothetical protein